MANVATTGPSYTVPEHENLEAGTYDATLAGVEERDGTDPNTGQPRRFWLWHFVLDIDGDDGERTEVERTAPTSAKLTPKSKGGKWAKTLRGEDIPTGPFDWSTILGKRCMVEITNEPTPDGVFDRIANVMAAPRRRMAAIPTANGAVVAQVPAQAVPSAVPGDTDDDEPQGLPF
jgi:hypothetical protein